MVDALPRGLSHSFAAGIGLFLSFMGLNEPGPVTIGLAGAPARFLYPFSRGADAKCRQGCGRWRHFH